MLLHALYERLRTAPLNRLPCYGALEVIVTLLLCGPRRGRILRRTLSVRLSVCLSVRPVIVAIGNVFSSTASVTGVLFCTH